MAETDRRGSKCLIMEMEITLTAGELSRITASQRQRLYYPFPLKGLPATQTLKMYDSDPQHTMIYLYILQENLHVLMTVNA